MANDIKLGDSHPLTEDKNTIMVGGEVSALEIAKTGKGARITGNLTVTGEITGKTDIQLDDDITCDEITCRKIVATSSAGGGFGYALALTGSTPIISGTDIEITDLGEFEIDATGDIILDAAGGDVKILQADVTIPIDKKVIFGNTGEYIVGDDTDLTIASSNNCTMDAGADIILDPHTGKTRFYLAGSTTDYAALTVAANGVTTITTIDNGVGQVGHLTLDPDGDVILDPRSGITKFYNNGDTDDLCTLTVALGGVTTIATADSDGAVAHLNIEADGHVEFDNCAVGFDKIAGTFSTSQVIGNGGHSTDIDFRLSNKYELELTDNMGATDLLNLIFPNTSGNFLLVISQDGTGSRTVHADSWVAYQSDGSTKATNAAFANGTDGDIRFAGGSAPTLTTTADKADIISIYWDADNQTAFAVVSQNF